MEKESNREDAVIVGVFDDTYQAERAIAELSQLGLGEGRVDFAMTEASTIAGSSMGDEPAYAGSEASQAIVRVRAGDRHQEVVDLLHRYGAFDVRSESDDTMFTSPGNARDYGSPGEASVRRGATGSPYDAERDTDNVDETMPPRVADVNTYNVDIEGTGEVKTEASSGAPAPTDDPSGYDTWERVRPYYQSRWRQQYVTAGRRWEDYEPAYRYGWERARMPDYQGRSWSEVEPRLRSEWEQGHNVSPWDRIADAVRDTWENLTGRHDRTETDRAA